MSCDIYMSSFVTQWQSHPFCMTVHVEHQILSLTHKSQVVDPVPNRNPSVGISKFLLGKVESMVSHRKRESTSWRRLSFHWLVSVFDPLGTFPTAVYQAFLLAFWRDFSSFFVDDGSEYLLLKLNGDACWVLVRLTAFWKNIFNPKPPSLGAGADLQYVTYCTGRSRILTNNA